MDGEAIYLIFAGLLGWEDLSTRDVCKAVGYALTVAMGVGLPMFLALAKGAKWNILAAWFILQEEKRAAAECVRHSSKLRRRYPDEEERAARMEFILIELKRAHDFTQVKKILKQV